MLDLFENNSWKKTNIFFAVIIVFITTFALMYAELLGDFGVFTAWSYLTIGGGLSLILLVGYDKTKSFFRQMNKGSWKWIFISIILGYLVSLLFVGIGTLMNTPLAENAGFEEPDTTLPLWIEFLDYSMKFVSLIGEEVITAAIAVIVFYFASKKFDSATSWVISAIISAIIFGLMHYTTYDGNIFQCVFVIGIGRLPFTYAWRKTGSLWGGIWAHVIYDVLLLVLTYLG